MNADAGANRSDNFSGIAAHRMNRIGHGAGKHAAPPGMHCRDDFAVVGCQEDRRTIRHAHRKQPLRILADQRIGFRTAFERGIASHDIATMNLVNPAARSIGAADGVLDSQ